MKTITLEKAEQDLTRFINKSFVTEIKSPNNIEIEICKFDRILEEIKYKGSGTSLKLRDLKIDKNTLVVFDSPDINSAYLHEYIENSISNLNIKSDDLDKINIFYIKSSNEFKQFFDKLHNTNKDHQINMINFRKEIMCWLFLIEENEDVEFMWKDDDTSIINEKVIETALDILITR